MNRQVMRVGWWLVVVACLCAGRAGAQSEAGTIAAVVGTLEVKRGASWQAAGIGVPVFVGDRLRTGVTDRAKIVFADESVLDIAPGTEVSVDAYVFDRPANRFQSLLRLARGKMRAWVSDYYRQPRARYEVQTP